VPAVSEPEEINCGRSYFQKKASEGVTEAYVCKSRRRCCRIESFDAWLRKGAFDIMQPDGTKVDEIACRRLEA